MKRASAMTRQPAGLFVRTYSLFVSRRFGVCGQGVQVIFPATVKNPGSVEVGDAVVIREHAWLNCEARSRYTLSIGSGSYIGRFVHINASQSVIIEDEVLIADRVHISDYQHAYLDLSRSIVSQGLTDPEPVRVRSGSWIGIGAVIMPGVTVGVGAIVGANAVVTRDVGDYEIVGGVPAAVIGTRTTTAGRSPR
jgi:carbonic anhydrase/acetyltransferase-like protein (isoleucine patch superfamily)